ncbi:hypothetical protein BDR26DRAFT_413296 [Obelidium mucronatum]|nr:hypothetical protein BDR26DRAFT_413296 [Obelidium mucronatum]
MVAKGEANGASSPSSPNYENSISAAILVSNDVGYIPEKEQAAIPSDFADASSLKTTVSRSVEVLNESTPKASRRGTIAEEIPSSIVIANAIRSMEPDTVVSESSIDLNYTTAHSSLNNILDSSTTPRASFSHPDLVAASNDSNKNSTPESIPSTAAAAAAAMIAASRRGTVRDFVAEHTTGMYTPPPVTAPKASHAVTTVFSPNLTDEIPLSLGDLVSIIVEFNDGWMEVLNLTTKQQGVVPGFCLSSLEGGSVSGGTVMKGGVERHWTAAVGSTGGAPIAGGKKKSILWGSRADSLEEK